MTSTTTPRHNLDNLDIQAEYAKLDAQPRPKETLDELLAVEMDILRLEALMHATDATGTPQDRATYTQKQREAIVKRAKLWHRLASGITFQAELDLARQQWRAGSKTSG